MASSSADEIRKAVSSAYGARAREVAAGEASACCDDGCCSTDPRSSGVKDQFYRPEQTGELPETVVSYGCGNPVAIGTLRPGEVVLDLGSGAGLDCFLAARQVGEFGRVFGLDMTEEMLALAESNKAKLGAEVANVSFYKGVMEALPFPDACVDVIISNCVINLSPDKDAVFREAFRVLRPGGRLHVSDVVLLRELEPAEQEDIRLWAGCIAGALEQENYRARLEAAGFSEVAIQLERRDGAAAEAQARPWRSALIDAYKPGAAAKPRRMPALGETIELVAVPGLATAPCCEIDADGQTNCS